MSKALYLGVSGVARKVSQPNIGVSSVARKVKSGHLGVSGVARQFFQGKISHMIADWTSGGSSRGIYVVSGSGFARNCSQSYSYEDYEEQANGLYLNGTTLCASDSSWSNSSSQSYNATGSTDLLVVMKLSTTPTNFNDMFDRSADDGSSRPIGSTFGSGKPYMIAIRYVSSVTTNYAIYRLNL